jgi:uncharacterized protein YdaU (DUF1376 family)
MHFYPHNIPDFNNATRHLTRVERSVYRDAIEVYYDTESPLPASDFNRLARLLLCTTKEEKEALELVLGEFFTLSDGVYYHSRCDYEIEKYRSNSTAKAKAGKASAEARKNRSKSPVEHALNSVEQNKNYELINNNQEIVITPKSAKQDKPAKKQKEELDYSVWPDQPDNKLFDDWKKVRKAKRAVITQTVIDDFGEEFRKAEKFGYSVNDCLRLAVTKGWQGFKFNWMQNEISKGVTGGAHKQTNQQCGLDPDDTSWADRVFGTGSPTGNPAVESGVQVIEGDFSSVGGGNPRS